MGKCACCGSNKIPMPSGWSALIVALLAFAPHQGEAAEQWAGSLQIHGFANQAFTLTSSNQVFGASEEGSLGLTELGLNASLRIAPKLQLSLQGLSRRNSVDDRGDVALDYGFVDIGLIADESDNWGVRFGRVKNPFGLYNETRDVAHTRPGVLLPQSIYFDRTRNAQISSDGLHLYGTHRFEDSVLDLRFASAIPRFDDREMEKTYLGAVWAGHWEPQNSELYQIMFEHLPSHIRVGASYVDINLGFSPGPGDPIRSGTTDIRFGVLSAQYSGEKWEFTGEYGLQWVEQFGYGIPTVDKSKVAESYYLQASYAFTPKWRGLLRYDVIYGDRGDKDGIRAARIQNRPAHIGFAKDWTAGLRWYVTQQMIIDAEYHLVDGTSWLSRLENADKSELVGNWDLFALQISYHF